MRIVHNMKNAAIINCLGYAGLIPFWAAAWAMLGDRNLFQLSPALIFFTYSAIILSFLGGTLWGKAREYYETSLKISPSAEAYGELGRLLKHLGETEAGESYLKNYDELVGTQLSNLPMPEPDKITH